MPTPLSLNDDDYAAVMQAAAPVHPLQRGAFLEALAKELEGPSDIGPGLVHRCAAELQKRYGVTAHSETGPRHLPAPRRAAEAVESEHYGRGRDYRSSSVLAFFAWASVGSSQRKHR